MLLKKGILSLLVLMLSFQVLAQKYVTEDSSPLERLYFGGNFGLQFGSNLTQIEVSPSVGYMITSNFSAGVGVVYQYFKADLYYPSIGVTQTVESNIYGGKLFARQNINDFLFAYTEFENLNLETYNPSSNEVQREWVPGFFLGGGLSQQIGRGAGIALVGLYNLMYDPLKSPYGSAFVVRLGFTF